MAKAAAIHLLVNVTSGSTLLPSCQTQICSLSSNDQSATITWISLVVFSKTQRLGNTNSIKLVWFKLLWNITFVHIPLRTSAERSKLTPILSRSSKNAATTPLESSFPLNRHCKSWASTIRNQWAYFTRKQREKTKLSSKCPINWLVLGSYLTKNVIVTKTWCNISCHVIVHEFRCKRNLQDTATARLVRWVYHISFLIIIRNLTFSDTFWT